MITIPASIVISDATVTSVLPPLDDYRPPSARGLFALYVLHERFNEKSPFYTYLRTLPETTHHPIVWSADHLALLEVCARTCVSRFFRWLDFALLQPN